MESKENTAMRLIDWILAAIAGLWAAEGCFGAELKGRVTDQAGAALSESTVVVRGADNGLSARQTTNEQGDYRFADLAPGPYSVRTSKAGFGAQQSYEIVIKGSATLDSQLSAASVARSVNRTTEPPVTAPGSLLLPRDAAALKPNNSNNQWMHVKLLPGFNYSAPKEGSSAPTPVLKRYMPGTDLAMMAYRQSPQLAHFFSPASNVDQRAAIRFRFTF